MTEAALGSANGLPRHEGLIHGEISRPVTVVAGACLLYLAVSLLVGRFAVTDEVAFKAAGRQWAAGAGFGAPELKGAAEGASPPVTEVYFLYPPAYPFFFGVWTRLFGFGPRQCMVFDASIHVLLTGLTFALAWRLLASLGHARGWWAVCAAVVVLPIGTVGRPDELAMSFGLLSLLFLLVPKPRAIHLALAGVALGSSLGTSVGAGIAAGCIALTLLIRPLDGLKSTLRRCLLVAVGTILGVSIAIGPLLVAHPGAIEQYLIISRFVSKNHGSIKDAWANAWPQAIKYYTFLVGTLAAGLLAATLAGTREVWRVWASYASGTALYLLFVGAVLAFRTTYTWFIGPWIAVASLHTIALLATTPTKRLRALLPGALLVAAWLSFAVHFVKETLVVMTLPASQGLNAASALLQEAIPPGATVVTSDMWWFIAARNRIYDPMFSHPPTEGIDYVALSGNGSGVPGRAIGLDARIWDPSFISRMVEVENNLPQHPTRVLGLRITNSGYGYGSIVYKVAPQRP
jgi:hypothetical protein